MKPTSNRTKFIYALILPLVIASGLVFANRDTSKKPTPKRPTAAEMKAEREKWEATPAGVKYKKWEASPEGIKVLAGATKIMRSVNTFTDMEAVVTSLSLPPGSRLGFGIMVRINGDDYILSFGQEKADKNFLSFRSEFDALHSLQVNDRITIRSRSVSHAPKYAYPIVSGDYVSRDGKIIYERAFNKDGC
ncbi:hypothetical protein KW844_20275 [Chitinophaga sp. sic0106]|nr:hypothetical protein [Chitinophaga sp. sic0106]